MFQTLSLFLPEACPCSEVTMSRSHGLKASPCPPCGSREAEVSQRVQGACAIPEGRQP